MRRRRRRRDASASLQAGRAQYGGDRSQWHISAFDFYCHRRTTLEPTSSPSKYNLSDAIAVAESAIAGDHLFEWSQAVAFARSLDSTGDQLADGLGTLITSGSPSEMRLALRFLKE